MKHHLMLAITFASLAATQDINGLPPCVLNCVMKAAATPGCQGMTDTQCACDNAEFRALFQPCLQANCTAQEQQTGNRILADLCNSASSTTFTSVPTETTTVTEIDTGTDTETFEGSTTTAPDSSSTTTTLITSGTTTAFGTSSPAVTPRTSFTSFSSRASSVVVTVSSSSTLTASATPSRNAAVCRSSSDFAITSAWMAVTLGGVAIAQLAL
ncbi:CFEM domain protein [Ceratobasidium sp. AG-Ba]|nr:CFEM domain protein [Ceratobasidium sp. AG-Ba]QRW12647.1 CFEM domain protein [Ceratobasidium sp. AG-Ba]